jgi:hypothetical protein
MKRVYEIDGSKFSTLEEFFAQIVHILFPGAPWLSGLDGFNDVLRGGFGSPEGGFILRWSNSALSRERLGYPETVRQLEKLLHTSLSSNCSHFEQKLELASSQIGSTVFDWLIQIIQIHCPGGAEEEDGVELILD